MRLSIIVAGATSTGHGCHLRLGAKLELRSRPIYFLAANNLIGARRRFLCRNIAGNQLADPKLKDSGLIVHVILLFFEVSGFDSEVAFGGYRKTRLSSANQSHGRISLICVPFSPQIRALWSFRFANAPLRLRHHLAITQLMTLNKNRVYW